MGSFAGDASGPFRNVFQKVLLLRVVLMWYSYFPDVHQVAPQIPQGPAARRCTRPLERRS